MNSTPKKSGALDILFFVISLLGTISCSMISLLIGLASLQAYLSGRDDLVAAGIWGIFSFAFLALCGIPVLFVAARALLRKEERSVPKPTPFSFLPLFLFPVALLLGYQAYAREILPVLLGPIAHILAATAAATFAIQISRQHGPMLTERRFWAHFIGGLWIVPLFALLAEIVVFVPLLLIFFLRAVSMVDGHKLLDALVDPSLLPLVTPDEITALLTDPWIIVLILVFFSGLVPLIEETLKTMIIWPWLFFKRPSEEVLMGGILGGAGYALFEALFLSQQAPAWLPVMIGRAGATMMHTFTTAIASWGLAEGFIQKRWGRTLLCFGIAIGFHGLWNASALSISLAEFALEQNGDYQAMLQFIGNAGPALIILMSILAVFGLPWLTRKLTHQSQSQPGSSRPDDTRPLER